MNPPYLLIETGSPPVSIPIPCQDFPALISYWENAPCDIIRYCTEQHRFLLLDTVDWNPHTNEYTCNWLPCEDYSREMSFACTGTIAGEEED